MLRELPEPRELTAGHWRLRPWRDDPDERAALLRAFADPLYRRWNTASAPTPDERGVQRFLDLAARGRREHTHVYWAVTEPPATGTSEPSVAEPPASVAEPPAVGPGSVLGGISLGPINRTARTAWIAYWLLPEARGRGVATGALCRVADWAFAELGLHRIELGHAAANGASCRVALRAGFAGEGLSREAMVATDGTTRHDVHQHGRLATDAPPGGCAAVPL
ncbi:GNAT family N-acetyltransferase [Streptomyces sp. XM4193]|uniref:GNAT family N-acetyltransferase n=1 Tax=Streptomyces sp. XM4193 TaxID=2929782 RepID=UPI001FFBD436|nr:GNAT family N-acetyltransferase [Streptomyces sp. XM4193]MCK1796730.1 GNAT family N-acetyltransferase [Streptomyces sp. XM4193]